MSFQADLGSLFLVLWGKKSFIIFQHCGVRTSFIFLQNHKLNFLNTVFIKEKHFVFSLDDWQIIDLLMLSFSDFINTFELWNRTHIYTLHIFKMYSDSRHSCTQAAHIMHHASNNWSIT